MTDHAKLKRYIEQMEKSIDNIFPWAYHVSYNNACKQLDDRQTDPEYLMLRDRFSQAVKLGKERGIL